MWIKQSLWKIVIYKGVLISFCLVLGNIKFQSVKQVFDNM